jgi:WD40 repeat protein
MDAHSHRQLHGLDVNPVNPDEFVTVGDDGMVRLWSISRCRCVNRVSIDVAARAVAYFPDGGRIVIGVGGDPLSATKDGEK